MGHPAPPPSLEPDPPRPHADWGRAASGIELAGVAVFLLLNTTGRLPWTFWLDALRLWPVLIIAFGVRIAFERSRVPWLQLLRPVLVLGTLAWVARGTLPEGPPGPWTPVSAERPADIRSVRFEASLPGARIDLAARPLAAGTLLEGRSASRSEETVLETGREGDAGHVGLHFGPGRRRLFVAGVSDRWDLALPSDLPVALALKGVAVRGHLDLSGGHVASVSARGVLLGLDLVLPRPDETVQVRVRGVFNVVHLVVPEGTPVRVTGAGLPFNLRDRAVNGTPSENRPGYEVRLQGVFNVLTVRAVHARPTPEAEPRTDGPTG